MKISNLQKPTEYFRQSFLWDLKAGLITGIVALPLAIAFSIASGVPPLMGMYTAVIAGILAAILGGSPFSITGPTAAMALIILSCVQKYGIEGLLLAGFLSGLFMLFFAFLKLGIVIEFIPLPVVSGFTAGIGTVILLGQIPNFLGVSIVSPAHTWELFPRVYEKIPDTNWQAIAIAFITILCMVILPKQLARLRYLKNLPASIFALAVSVAFVYSGQFQIPTVGEIPSSIPHFQPIKFSFSLALQVLPSAFTIALLGAIESLLCAMVADGMSNTKHKSNRELFGQGITNVVVPFFGGIPATAAIARTAVNIREGAKTRFAAVYHALFLLCVLLFLGPLAVYLPKAFLAGVLFITALRMMNFRELKTILTLSKSDTLVYFSAFFLTVFTDLVVAIQMSTLLAMFLLFVRLVNVTNIVPLDGYDTNNEIAKLVHADEILKDKVAIFTLNGPFFFGVINLFERKINEHVHTQRPIIILRMKYVPFIDATAAICLKEFVHDRQKQGGVVLVSTLSKEVQKTLEEDEELTKILPAEHRFKTTKRALKFAKQKLTVVPCSIE